MTTYHQDVTAPSLNVHYDDSHHDLSGTAPIMQPWMQWQAEVVATLSQELAEVVDPISLDDVDWVAWYGLYLDGRSPRAAVDRALERDL